MLLFLRNSQYPCLILLLKKSSPKDILIDLRDRQKHEYERETSIGYLPYMPRPGIKPAT